jgi:endonuclease/exonuclease/phosphatase family metal-dependent hydrolase
VRQSNPTNTLRIVSYNILDGGGRRAGVLGDVIEAQQPDVVGLVEAEDLAVVEGLAGRLGMDFVHAPGNSHASALLSRWTIRDSINHALLEPALSKSLLEVTVIDPAGREWVFGVVHFHAGAAEADERRREEELAVVLRVFAPHREAGRPHLLCGDFNANSPVQQIDPARCKPRTRKEWEQNGGHIPRRVVQRLLDAGYVDSLHAAYPREAQTTASFTTEHPGQRVDYVFTFAIDPGRIKSAWVYQVKPAADASDHFPAGAEIL